MSWKTLILLTLFCVILFMQQSDGSVPQDKAIENEFKKFQVEYKKVYKSVGEKNRRFTIFKENLLTINAHNQLYKNGKKSYKMGINQFADWTKAEFAKYSGTRVPPTRVRRSNFNSSKLVEAVGANNIPAFWDWRQHHAVTPVRDQGRCGASWAFASIGALEGIYAIKFHSLITFSEQQLIDCVRGFGKNGCSSGFITDAFNYMDLNGVERASAYPYEAREGPCRYNRANVVVSTGIDHFVLVEEHDEHKLAEAVLQQPVTAGVSSTMLQHYHSGIFDDEDCEEFPINHSVLIVGYGKENGRDYWLIKNSWGTRFGEQGYMKFLRGKNVCNIGAYAHYPVLPS